MDLLKKLTIWVVVLMITGLTAPAMAGFETGNTYNGFKLREKKYVKEVNAECLYFQHEKSGARLVKVLADDANKTFSIAFKTVPESDAGTPHIMEHSVLNGSKNFPVKSPFDVLAKGSLNTFLNAMTGGDVTIYPVASMNDKDYFNLMHVYLDAVFNPLIYDDPRILMQEGWHHELENEDAPVVYKGVVYNEMKGAYSSPTRELDYQIYKYLFPDNGYGFSSGGYPQAIPTLTYEDFLNFHRKYYHPSNSYILLYGDADTNAELEFINEKYLKNYDLSDKKVEFPFQKPFPAPKKIIAPYAVPEESETDHQSYLTISIVTGKNTDRALVMALDILTDVLVNHESGPVRLALQEAGIGRDVRAVLDDVKQNVFQIIVQNANTDELDKFNEIVFNVLRESADKGLDKKMVEGVINRMEFRLREGNDAQKGLTYAMRALNGWFFADDPFLSLEYEQPLAEVKTALETDYLEKIIKTRLLENPHTLMLALEPKPGLEGEINEQTEAELAAYKASLGPEETEKLVQQTEELIAYQKREDTPEDLASIPLLNLSDINPKAEWFDLEEQKVDQIPLLVFKDFTNRVVYSKLYFNASVLPQELIPYAALLTELLGSLNTENYTYGELDNELNIHTGGFSSTIDAYLVNQDDKQLLTKVIISSKAMYNKVDKMYELMAEVVNETRYTDTDRLKSVLTRHQSRLEQNVTRNGFGYALRRQVSYYSQDGMFGELTRGMDYYWFITKLTNDFEAMQDEIIKNLTRTAGLLFSRTNLVTSLTCTDEDLASSKEALQVLLSSLPDTETEPAKWDLTPRKKNEALLAASKVQYVIKGYDYKQLGYEYSGKMRVLQQILSREWLQNRIRVIGGAYGGFARFSPNGQVYFGSYRDPNLVETLENFDATPGYLRDFDADETEMTRFIIGTIAGMDRPLTSSQKGDRAVQRFFEKTTREDMQSEREAVLSVSAEDIKGMEKLVTDILKQNAYCVYGNEEKIREAKDLFGALVPLTPEEEKE